jgi:hypothetical protein
MVKDRRSGSRNWTRGFFAFFWIVLAGFSSIYLFSVFIDPSAFGGQLGRFSPLPVGGAPSSGTDTFASGSLGTNGGSDPELAEIKATLRQLSQQMAEINTRLKPIEKVVGPVASLPPGSSGSTSSPTPEPVAPAKKPEATSAPTPPATPPAEQAKVKPPEPKPVETKPAEEVKPAPAAETKPSPTPPEAAKPTQQAALEPKPSAKPAEPPSVASAPLDEEPDAGGADSADSDASAASEEAPSPSPSASNESAKPAGATESGKPAGTTESASLDPVALPPAANDGSTRYGIEIGTVAKQDGLRPLWREFLTNHSALVAGLQPRRVLAPDKKWRLIAGPFSNAAEAAQACALFKKASRPCEATVYAGDAL